MATLTKGTKRKHSEDIHPSECRFGKDCYRRNVDHFQEFLHPDGSTNKSKDECLELFQENSNIINPESSCSKTTTNINDNDNDTYSFYFNKVVGIESCFNQSCLSMRDILSDRFGNLIRSVQFNYLIDIQWLMRQYPLYNKSKPLLIVHGFKDRQKTSLQEEANTFDNVRLCQADLRIPFGTHHTKMMIHLYEEGVRVVIMTANLIENDWTKKTQSIWISPMFPKRSNPSSDHNITNSTTKHTTNTTTTKSTTNSTINPTINSTTNTTTIKSTTNSTTKRTINSTTNTTTIKSTTKKTNFGEDLIEYLSSYKKHQIDEWIRIINDHDLSDARVYLVASIPGRFDTATCQSYGHLKLRSILKEECSGSSMEEIPWPVICQTSSIGSLGNQSNAWLTGEFLTSLSACCSNKSLKSPDLKIVYPSVENIRCSLEGYMAGGSFPYSAKVASKQQYLKRFMHQWKFDTRGRSSAMPHLKSYFRPSRDNKRLAWYLMTSANVSKAAWGSLEKNGSQLFIRSYEIGVLYAPRLFQGISSSPPSKGVSSSPPSKDILLNDFPVSVDLPVVPYSENDDPWVYDVSYTERSDSHGRIWKLN